MDDHVVELMAQPVVASFLLALGLLGLRAEAGRKRFGEAGAAGLLALALLFGSHIVVGKTALGELLMVLIGVTLLSVRGYLARGFALLGLVGGALTLAGLWLSLVEPQPSLGDFVRAALVLSAAALLCEGVARTLAGPRYISPRAILRSTVWRIPPFR